MNETGKQDVAVIGMRVLATDRLVQRLKDGRAGDILTDEELTEACEKDTRVTGEGYSNLQSAIAIVLREQGIVWKRIVKGNAIQCLDASGIATLARSSNKHIQRRAKTAVRQLNTVKIDEVPEKERPAYRLLGAQLGTLAIISADATRKKLEARNIGQPLDMPRLLAAFANG